MRRQITLEEVFDTRSFCDAAAIYKIMPGIVTAYHDERPPSIDVQPAVHDVRFNTDSGDRESEPFPILPKVPIGFLKFGGFAIFGPMAVGDKVTLLGFDLDPTKHQLTGNAEDPIFTRRHGGFSWVALPIDITDIGPLPSPAGDLVLMHLGSGTQIQLTSSGVSLGTANAPDFAALASKSDIDFGAVKTLADALNTYALAIKGVADPTNVATPALTAAVNAFKAAIQATGSSKVKIAP